MYQNQAIPNLQVNGRKMQFGDQEAAERYAKENGLTPHRLPGVNKGGVPEVPMTGPSVHQATVEFVSPNTHGNRAQRFFKPNVKVEHEVFWVPPGPIPRESRLAATKRFALPRGHQGYAKYAAGTDPGQSSSSTSTLPSQPSFEFAD